ncbi:MAG: hypothetical protein EHM40_02770 [Chloroflexi bacterium]|nr:MAG: hypothetical protein EHM40_02770 [Chloroflexota bacterium]
MGMGFTDKGRRGYSRTRRDLLSGASVLALAPHTWFDFSDLSTLFQDADGTTAVAADADPIGKVLDKSGNAHHLTQGTEGARPAYKTGIQGNRAAALGDGGDHLDTAAFTEIAQPNTIFLVARNPAYSGTEVYFDGIASDKRHAAFDYTDQINWFAGSSWGGGVVATESTLYEVVFNGANSPLFENGVGISSGDAGAQALTGITLFGNFEGGGNLSGYIMEFLLFNSALSVANRELVRSYLNEKWKVY